MRAAYDLRLNMQIRPAAAPDRERIREILVATARFTESELKWAMELVDSAVVLAVPGAMDAGITSLLFWSSLAFSLVVAFVLTTPLNRVMMGRGKGHAVVHAYHH